jgi:hypothetical protein
MVSWEECPGIAQVCCHGQLEECPGIAQICCVGQLEECPGIAQVLLGSAKGGVLFGSATASPK